MKDKGSCDVDWNLQQDSPVWSKHQISVADDIQEAWYFQVFTKDLVLATDQF